MSEEDFAKLNTHDKWIHIKTTMDYIISMDNVPKSNYRLANCFQPTFAAKEKQRSMRLDQYQRWDHIKTLYAVHRDELNDTMGQDKFSEAKALLERIFTNELDDAMREVIGEEQD